MELLEHFISFMNSLLSPVLVIGLLSAGLILTVRLGFIQFRRLGHGFAVATGKYDDPDEPGDVTHFQALTTALSATVGIGNIAGVAIAIHIGGPGALFWMWVTALLGMATKYSEVTLAQHYRVDVASDGSKWAGSVAGGPMYYIQNGLKDKLGSFARPMALFFAFALMLTSFMTGNAIQANTLATQVYENFGVANWITGLITAGIVGFVILGGIKRIGAVTGVLAPVMASIYVLGALAILLSDVAAIGPAFATIFSEAFNPTSGTAGTGIGLFLVTARYGVQRGLFSNEAGQGSAPIAHSAAKTDEPVSEGVVALLEPFIDTILICTMTGLVIITTGVWQDKQEGTRINFSDGNVSWVEEVTYDHTDAIGYAEVKPSAPVTFENGVPVAGGVSVGYFDVAVDTLYLDENHEAIFSGVIDPVTGVVTGADGAEVETLYGAAVKSSSPLTAFAFTRGLDRYNLGGLGNLIVLISVILFALSTAISWSYYGDRCAHFIWGTKGIMPFKVVFLVMHFLGATLAVTTIWDLGDVALSLVTIPNILALVLLSGLVRQITNSYFERRPWVENAEVHKRWVESKKKKS